MPFWHLCQKHSPATAHPKHSRTSSNSLQASHQYSTIAETPLLASGLISHTIQDSPAHIQISSFNCPSIAVFTHSVIQPYTKSTLFQHSETYHSVCTHLFWFSRFQGPGWLALQFGTPCLALSKHAHLFIALKNNWNHTCSPLLSPSSQFFPSASDSKISIFYNLAFFDFVREYKCMYYYYYYYYYGRCHPPRNHHPRCRHHHHQSFPQIIRRI